MTIRPFQYTSEKRYNFSIKIKANIHLFTGGAKKARGEGQNTPHLVFDHYLKIK